MFILFDGMKYRIVPFGVVDDGWANYRHCGQSKGRVCQKQEGLGIILESF